MDLSFYERIDYDTHDHLCIVNTTENQHKHRIIKTKQNKHGYISFYIQLISLLIFSSTFMLIEINEEVLASNVVGDSSIVTLLEKKGINLF
jgi:uncharacterized membrane protein